MVCFVENCDNNIVTDCVSYSEERIKFHLDGLHKEYNNIVVHYKAMKIKLDNTEAAKHDFRKKYESEKENYKKLKQEMSKKRSTTTCDHESPKKVKIEAPTELGEQIKGVLFASKTRTKGKENSPKKQDDSFSRIGDQFKNLPSKSRKDLKQQKLQFTKNNPSTLTKVRQEKVLDSDETYCEELERLQRKGSVWLSKANLIESNKKNVLTKTSTALTKNAGKPREKLLKKSTTISNLFQFNHPVRQPRSPALESDDATPDLLQLNTVKVKKEPLSELNAAALSDDLFSSDAESSNSVILVEPNPQDNLAITIPEHTFYSIDAVVKELEEGFLKQPEFGDSESDPVIPVVKKRKLIYGECRDCREFYDNYAEKNGVTAANEYIRACSTKCKGFFVRKKLAEPALPPSHSIRHRDGETPEGFWDIPFTP